MLKIHMYKKHNHCYPISCSLKKKSTNIQTTYCTRDVDAQMPKHMATNLHNIEPALEHYSMLVVLLVKIESDS